MANNEPTAVIIHSYTHACTHTHTHTHKNNCNWHTSIVIYKYS